MSDFHFDRVVISKRFHEDEGLHIAVTRCDAEDIDVQVNIRPEQTMWPATTFFLSAEAAAELGRALLAAVEEKADAS